MKFRISIREQLGLLVLLCCLVSLAVITVATWLNSYNFVIGARLASLSLSASLYGEQLTSNLNLLQASVLAMATRVLVQSALQRYDDGNNTVADWAKAGPDIDAGLGSGGTAQYLLQARVVSKNGTGTGGPYGLLNVTGDGVLGTIELPYTNPNGTLVHLGDEGSGYPPPLYPNLTFTSTVVNSTFNASNAFYGQTPLYANSTLLLGPWQLNESYALISMTVPIINNTSATDTLGWLTVVMNAELIFSVQNSVEGLGNTGIIALAGPAAPANGNIPPNLFAQGIKFDSTPQLSKAAMKQEEVQFVLPPPRVPSRSTRHARYAFGQPGGVFEMESYPSILDAVTVNNNVMNNAGSLLSSNNEENDQVSVGYAMVASPIVDWVILIEQSYNEVIAPVHHLRNILIACVFGTTGGILLLLFPIAHFSVRPIRELRAATKRSVEPYGHPTDDGRSSIRTSISGDEDGQASGDEENLAQVARKEGFIGQMTRWGRGRRKSKAERQDQARRQEFRIPGKVQDRKHFINDELTDLTRTFNEMSEELMMQYERLEERVRERTRELELSKKAAEAANESKTLFIANISHELKTPLNGILGMTAVCLQEDDPSKIKRSLNIIYKSGDLLLHLLTDLLTFSKNQIGQQLTLDEREFRLADVSSQILSIFDKQARDGAINLHVIFEGPNESLETASGTPGQSGYGPFGTGRVRDMCLWGDQHRILQVIINLVSNSLKFTPRGGSVEVRIKCEGESDEDKAPSSRKDSSQSRQSRQSKHHSSNTSKTRGRIASGSDASVSPSVLSDGDPNKSMNTTLEINGREPKSIPHVAIRERSSSPAPINARTLLFSFDVEDTGPGIPASQQRKVFEPFVQGDLGLSKKYGGTGLGLSICSQLAGLMKGSITLKSQEGVGSTFTMRIPLKFTKEIADSTTGSNVNLSSARDSTGVSSIRDEPRTPNRARSSEDISVPDINGTTPTVNSFEGPASKPRLVGLSQPFFAASPPLESPKQQLEAMERVAIEASQKGDKVRVLVAEDNMVNQEVVLRMLKLEDIYDVTLAKDGQEAFELVKESMETKKFFNLIFMDIQMPNLDGLQSTRLIRGMGFSAPIVALTAFAEESNVKECMDSGMDFFLPKPIRRPALKQVLKKYCATIPEAAEEDSPTMKTSDKKRVPPPDDDAVSPMS